MLSPHSRPPFAVNSCMIRAAFRLHLANGRAISRLYRERGDPDWSEAEIAEGRENIFGEMKNHCGWGEFVTQDMKRTAIVAGLGAFVANVWNILQDRRRRLARGGAHGAADDSNFFI